MLAILEIFATLNLEKIAILEKKLEYLQCLNYLQYLQFVKYSTCLKTVQN